MSRPGERRISRRRSSSTPAAGRSWTTALHRALSEGWIAGAALDDIEEEPAKVRDWRPDNPLLRLDNVIVTPHAAYYSEEAIGTVRHSAAEEVVRVLTARPPLSPVNAGELAEARWSRPA